MIVAGDFRLDGRPVFYMTFLLRFGRRVSALDRCVSFTVASRKLPNRSFIKRGRSSRRKSPFPEFVLVLFRGEQDSEAKQTA